MDTSAILPSDVEQGVVHSVDHGVFDLQPEECGVVGLAAEDLLIGELGRQRVDGLYGFRDGLAAGEWLIAERAVQHHVLGEATGDGVFACAAVHAVDEGLGGTGYRWVRLALAGRTTTLKTSRV
jgi:hypothetical protein